MRLYDRMTAEEAARAALGLSVGSLGDRVSALEQGTPPTVFPQVIPYQEDSGAFLNPGQGFYKLYAYPNYGTSFADHASEASGLRTTKSLNVILLVFNLNAYRGTDTVAASFITNTIRASFTALRNAGFKAIVRFVYDYSGSATNDPANARVLLHIAQVADACNDNKDVILAYQGGWVGAYGEWFDSTNQGSDNWPIGSNGGSLKAAIIQKMLDEFEDRRILLRYPRHLRYLVNEENWGPDGTSPNPGSPRVTPIDRLGNHNDSFLESLADGGTYEWPPNTDQRGDKAWLIGWLAAHHGPSSGEEEDFGDQSAGKQTQRKSRFGEFASLRFHALSEDYSTGTTDMWKATTNPATGRTYWEDLKRYMGARLVFLQGSFPLEQASGGAFAFDLEVKNVGYGDPLIDYDFKVRFGAVGPIDVTPDIPTSEWYKGGATHTVHFTGTAPTLSAGTQYPLRLDMVDPDGAPSPTFNWRPANTGVWDGTNGRIDLKVQVEGA